TASADRQPARPRLRVQDHDGGAGRVEAMIVCPQPLAAEEGREVLRRGGNAVDAAVTTAFVQGVIDPMMNGLGGSGVAVVYSARERSVSVVDFYARAGSQVRPDQWESLFIREAADRYGYVCEGWVNDCGYQSVGVPGTVAGLDELLRRVGTVSWDQAGLAAAGARDFYEGEIAAAIADDFQRNGGFITREDLASYRVGAGQPVRGRYRDMEVVAAGPPAGGMTLLQMLNFLEGFDLAAMGW